VQIFTVFHKATNKIIQNPFGISTKGNKNIKTVKKIPSAQKQKIVVANDISAKTSRNKNIIKMQPL